MNPEDDLEYEPAVQPEEADLPHRDWECPCCGFINSAFDGECQNCDEGNEVLVPCVDKTENHEWVVSDENENICYCSRCGCCEY